MTPFMSQEEIEFIEKFIKFSPESIMLEWGSGGSTVHFSQYVRLYNSIEHKIEYYIKVREALVEQSISNVNHYLIDYPNFMDEINEQQYDAWGYVLEDLANTEKQHDLFDPSMGGDPKKWYVWRYYIRSVEHFGSIIYDFVLVDGRSRVECALKALEYITDDSIVFIHDFFPRYNQYKDVLNFYNIHDSIVGEQSVVALKRK